MTDEARSISSHAIRRRPGMYVGWTTHAGVVQIVWELVANSIDQVLARRASRVEIVDHDDGSIEVIDDGPGLDLLDPRVRSYFLEFHNTPTADAHAPHVHIAHRGVGLVVATALSSRLVVTTRHGDRSVRCDWTNGGEAGVVR